MSVLMSIFFYSFLVFNTYRLDNELLVLRDFEKLILLSEAYNVLFIDAKRLVIFLFGEFFSIELVLAPDVRLMSILLS